MFDLQNLWTKTRDGLCVGYESPRSKAREKIIHKEYNILSSIAPGLFIRTKKFVDAVQTGVAEGLADLIEQNRFEDFVDAIFSLATQPSLTKKLSPQLVARVTGELISRGSYHKFRMMASGLEKHGPELMSEVPEVLVLAAQQKITTNTDATEMVLCLTQVANHPHASPEALVLCADFAVQTLELFDRQGMEVTPFIRGSLEDIILRDQSPSAPYRDIVQKILRLSDRPKPVVS